MLLCTTWKARPLSPEQTARMMDTWAKLEADTAERPGLERLCWYLYADGSGGFTVSEASDEAVASAFGLETTLALGEFLEFDTKIVYDMDAAMPAITAAVSRING